MINNLDKFYHSREEVFNFFRDYTAMMFDSSHQAKQDETKRTGFQILTPKQMFERLPIALAQVKTGNNSKVLLNKIRPIVSSFHQSKEITKKSIQKHNKINPNINNGYNIYELRKQ